MDDNNTELLPYILQTISQKPEMCDTYENLWEELKFILSTENLIGQETNMKKHLENALDFGRNLGILTVTKDLIRVPFNYNNASKPRPTATRITKKVTLSPEQEEYFVKKAQRKHKLRPTVAHGRQRRRGPRRRRRSRHRR